MNETLVLLATLAAAVLSIAATASLCSDLLLRDKSRIQQRLTNEFQLPERNGPHRSPLFRDLKILQSKTDHGHGINDLWIRFELKVEQSGLPWTPLQIVSVGLAIVGLLTVATFLSLGSPIIAVAVFVVLLPLPVLFVEVLRQRRSASISRQLPDAFDQMKRSVRAGQPLVTAMQQIANDFPPPLADEFAICCQKLELGLPHSIALQDLARRINIMEFQMFVVTVLLQRDVGGNIAEILSNLSHIVRKRFQLAARAKALTTEGRMQAIVLAALPLVAGGLMYFLNPTYVTILFDYPKILMALVASELIGALWIRRIVSFEY